MSRPILPPNIPGEEGWDAILADWIDLAFNRPMPLYEAATLTDLETDYPAAENEGCLCAVNDTGDYGWQLGFSDGTKWLLIPKGSAYAGFYGGVTALSSSADTTLAIGVTTRQVPSAFFSVASNEVTCPFGVEGGEVSYSVTANLTSGTTGRFSVKVEIDTGGGFAAVAGSQRHGCVQTGAGEAYDTVAWSGPVDIPANAVLRLRAFIEGGTGTPAISTIAQGVQFNIKGSGVAA